MRFRSRLFLALGVVAVVPLAIFAFGVRRELNQRLAAQDADRIAALVARVRDQLAQDDDAVAQRLATLTESLGTDNRFRLAVRGVEAERSYLLDYAERAVRLTGLDMLQIQDETGRILSSGHFRNEYDRVDPALPAFLGETPEGAGLVRARTPAGTFEALVRSDSFSVGALGYTVTGGVAVDEAFLALLAADDRLEVRLHVPGGASDTVEQATVVWADTLPFVDPRSPDGAQRAELVVMQVGDPLADVLRRVNLWFGIVMAGTTLLAVLAALTIGARISRPLSDLARRTAEVDLDRLDVEFPTGRRDEIGALSRLLAAMTGRLRDSAGRLRDAERRATVGDLARQVNHDIKNGLIPIRNVFRHLTDVSAEQPDELPGVFAERRGTVESSIAYLETLAGNYARLSPRAEHRPTDVNDVLRSVAHDVAAGRDRQMRLDLGEALPAVRSDAIVLRRVLENLLRNALESLHEARGTVAVRTVPAAGESGKMVRITVRDTGRGMTEDQLAHAFDDFYTTKETGTGLGLSIVRRLVADLGGTLRVATEPGTGSTFEIDLPASGPPARPPDQEPNTA